MNLANNSPHSFSLLTTIAICTAITISAVTTNTHANADTTRGKKSPGAPTGSSSSLFAALKSQPDSWKIIKNPAVIKKLKATMGTAYSTYLDSTQLVESPKLYGDELSISAGVRGLFTEIESILIINTKSGAVTAGILDHRTLSVYGASPTRLPAALLAYQADFQKRTSDKLSITFRPPAKNTAANVFNKDNLTDKTNGTGPTGTYRRTGSSELEAASLMILALPGSRLKFSLDANSGGNTGQASGIIVLVRNQSTYSDPSGYKLHFSLNKNKIKVSQEGNGFGGMGVNADGIYERISKHPPKF